MLAPIVAFVALVLVRSPAGRYLAVRVPLAWLIGLQAFRVGVELTLHRLWELGSVPKLMTLSGGNIEILVGFSAPLFAWIVTRIGLPWPAPVAADMPTFFPVRTVSAFLWAAAGYGARRVLKRDAR